jgi:two-component system, NtrC family, sensor kinase
MGLNITQKLILIIIVLVVTPILATGLMANRAAKGIVTQLLNESQITLAREIAEQANQLFRTARADVKILSALPALSDFYYNRFYGLQSEAEISRKQIEHFFLDVAKKSEFYYCIDYVDAQGERIVDISRDKGYGPDDSADRPLDEMTIQNQDGGTLVSAVLTFDHGQRRVIRFSQPLYDVWNNLSGTVRLELDFDQFSSYILSRRVGLKGHAFVLDTEGRIQVYPERHYVGKRYDQIEESSISELIQNMLGERQGMVSYEHQGSKVAAFTPVEENGWVVAVTLPESEFAERVNIIGQRMLLIVMLAASFSVGVGIIFSWHFVKPIKELARATNTIAAGDLPSQVESTSSDELGTLTRSFNHMVRNLRRVQAELVKSEKLVSLGRLATGVAHEIRNPLNSMKVAAEILDNKQTTRQEAQELVKLICNEISHLDNFVTNFLSYARQPSPSFIESDVNQLVEDLVQSVAPRIKKNKVELSMVMTPDLPSIRMDPFQMERALSNIVTNAIEAMPDGGRLRIATSRDGYISANHSRASIQIVVSDSGIGLPSDQIQQVFDPFFTTKDYGTGLGLSLTKSIVETHGGSIAIDANPDAGMTVTVRLPEEKPDRGEENSDATK